MREMTAAMGLLAALVLSSCSHGRPVTISVGDSAAEAWEKLESQGHQVANIPLDGRIEQNTPTPDGGSQSKVVGMTVPYDVNGRIVLFTHEYSKNTISGIMTGDKSLTSFEVQKAVKQK